MWWFAAYLLPLVGLNLALSSEPHASTVVLARWILVLVVGLSLAATARGEGRMVLARLTAGAGALAALVGIWQGSFGFSRQAAVLEATSGWPRDAALARLGSGRVSGTLLLPSSLAGALAVTLPVSVVLLAGSKTVRSRLLYGLSSMFQAAALLWTFSLGAWLSLALASGVVLGPQLVRTARGRKALLAGATLSAAIFASGLLARRMLLPTPGLEDRPVDYRVGNWIVATAIIGDHPLFGTGIGTFGNVFPQYRREGMNESRHAHNSYLELAAELGFGALPLLLLVAVAAYVLCRPGRVRDPLTVAAAIGAVSFLLQNAVDFTLYQPSVGVLFATALVLATSGSGDLQARKEALPPQATEVKLLARTPCFLGILIAALAAGAVLVGSGLSDMARERAMIAHDADPASEEQALRLAARLDPLDPEAHGDLASLLSGSPAGAPALDRALAEAEQAAALDPRTPFRHRELARIELMRGRPASAWIALARAASLYPLKADYSRDLRALEQRLFEQRLATREP